jgi:hypothetical protein
MAYSSLVSLISLWDWALTSSTVTYFQLISSSVTPRKSRFASAFFFLEIVRFFSRETHNRRHHLSSLMSSLSQRSTL